MKNNFKRGLLPGKMTTRAYSGRSVDRLTWVIGTLLLVVLVVVFSQARINYEFFYSDAPRHALNGAFILDLVKTFPIDNPVQWAYNYYAQYPALTILFYPPLYPAVLAIAYAIFGISQFSAVVVNALFYAALMAGVYRIATRYMDRPSAAAAAVLVGAAPEMAFWGRQIMTDVPATAALVWAFEGLLAYTTTYRSKALYLGAMAAVAAVWLKITVCFLLPVLALGLLASAGRDIWRQPRYWLTLVGVMLTLLPLIWLTLNFGQTNVESVSGVADGAASRTSLANWFWYAERVPQQLGWPAAIAVLIGLGVGLGRLVAIRRVPFRWALLMGWLIVGYLFFSAIDLKAARFTLPILPPLVILGAWGLRRLLGAWPVAAYGVLSILGTATLIWTLVERPALYVPGYAEIVKDVTKRAPADSNIVFSGYRDGAFIFAMRAIGDRPDIDTVRADKLLLSVAIRRSTGVKQNNLSREQIAQTLTRQRAAYVVAQDDFWIDLSQMKKFQQVLRSPQFTPVAHYRLNANFNTHDKRITVYKNNASLPAERPNRSIDLPAIDRTVNEND